MKPVQKHSSRFYLIARSPVFADLNEDQLQFVADRVSLAEFLPEQEIYRAGVVDDAIHILVSGVAASVVPGNERTESQKHPVEVFRRGDILGLVSLMSEKEHTYDAVAVTEIKALRIRRQDLEAIQNEIPSLVYKFSQLLSSRLRNIRSRGKSRVSDRIIAIVSLDDRITTDRWLDIVSDYISNKAGYRFKLLHTTFSPETHGSDSNLQLHEKTHFASTIDSYLEESDIVVMRVLHRDFHRIVEIEQEIDRIFIISSSQDELDKFKDSIQSGYEFLYNYKQLPNAANTVLEHKRLESFAREILDKQIGLVLGGGAALGLAQIGILQILEEYQIHIDMVSGTSIGALIGGLWCSGMSGADLQTLTAEFDSVFKVFKLADLTIPKQGLLTGNQLLKFLNERIGDARIETSPVAFRAVACDIRRRQELVISSGLFSEAIRMSTAIPGIFEPVHYNDMEIVDGGIVNPVPVSVLNDAGIRRVIAVNSMPSSDVLMKSDQKSQGILDIMINSLYSLQYRIGKYAAGQVDVYMNPVLKGSSWYEFYRADEFIDYGRQAAESVIEEIRSLQTDSIKKIQQ